MDCGAGGNKRRLMLSSEGSGCLYIFEVELSED